MKRPLEAIQQMKSDKMLGEFQKVICARKRCRCFSVQVDTMPKPQLVQAHPSVSGPVRDANHPMN